MATAKVVYQGQLRTQATHLASGNEITTDAPVDNHGKGQAFSPTDLVTSALGSCLMTIMGIKAESLGVDLTGMHAEVTKIMATSPRRIAEIHVSMHMPSTIDATHRQQLEAVALACPVSQSLHPETKQHIQFHYDT
ncbi:OsmC family protein [Ostreibacterium oceani]|uniref:OsmC family peroxiredoxin n=1 Tax=Ostreibacterium oceani TaxID=2654998 RepID=A0A6N7EXK4_9GAMM|nr:OsmC family protein [Ostreibacterium oceani]MPV86109.1 OsmC family peroxiredoxin [Ostreibacterium oceani]